MGNRGSGNVVDTTPMSRSLEPSLLSLSAAAKTVGQMVTGGRNTGLRFGAIPLEQKANAELAPE
jgi:hypothetical protein